MTCLVTKFTWNFAIYWGKKEAPLIVGPIARREPKLAHKIMMELSKDIKGKKHVTAMDNFFTSVGLFKDLASWAIFVTWIIRSNCVGAPIALKDKETFNKMP